jgi:RarD protein
LKLKNLRIARGKLIVAMAIWGTISLFVKQISMPSAEIALFRAVIAIAILLVFKRVTDGRFSIPNLRSEWIPLLLSGAAMGANWVLLFEAYRYTTVSVATLSYYFAPVLVMVLSPVLFHEHSSWKQRLCFLFSTIGLVLVVNVGQISLGDRNLTGILLGLGAAGCYAGVMLLNKFCKRVGGIDRTIIQFVSAGTVLLVYILFTSGITISSLDHTGLLNLLILGTIHTGFSYCLFFTAVKELPGQESAILSYIDPFVSILVSVFLLHEKMTGLQCIGGALILGFTLLNELDVELSKKSTIKE